jgi:hypothetical protein
VLLSAERGRPALGSPNRLDRLGAGCVPNECGFLPTTLSHTHTHTCTHTHAHAQITTTKRAHAQPSRCMATISDSFRPFPKDAPISTGGSICFAAAQHTARPVCLAERVCIGRPHRCACMRVGCALSRPDAHRHTDCGRAELGRLALYGASRRAVPVRQRFCGTSSVPVALRQGQ